ncbi:hypothetical protein [Desertihabitans aurantiacus]|uniref:hypothetical protein n=1 Tax=Desertihabitans aurantiacus TaxID=2282477 RepID=UPI000DF74F34|nr:hypothetical protein [Desertihabitans aurantiacus]
MTLQEVPGSQTPEDPRADEVAELLWVPFTRWEFVAERENLDVELGPPEPWEDRSALEDEPDTFTW